MNPASNKANDKALEGIRERASLLKKHHEVIPIKEMGAFQNYVECHNLYSFIYTEAPNLIQDIERLVKAVEVLRDKLTEIESYTNSCLLGECCPKKLCYYPDDSKGCVAQIASHNAFNECACIATEALAEASRILEST